ncbi:hypothetical protein CR513_24928, partial [Mucuna pruriens]
MNPYDAERLRDEVIYLHSLWHQGPPPPQNPFPFPSPSQHTWHLHPRQQLAPARIRSLPPVPSTTFKKKKNCARARPDPGLEWSCLVRSDPSPSPTIGWAKPKPGPAPPDMSPQEKERLAGMKAQQKACRVLKEFLSSYGDDHSDDDDDGDGWEEFEEFLVGVFLEDDELRRYYQRCYESGEFCCLVCSAVGKKNSGKRYKDCVGLVQHSRSILRTVNRRAHRGFGLAVCKVLGWDVDRLPTIVVKGKPLGLETKLVEAEGEPKENNVANDDGRKDGSHESDDGVLSLEHGDKSIEEPTQGVDQSINKCSSNEGDQDETMLSIGVQNGGGGEGESEEKVEDGKDGAHKSGFPLNTHNPT